MARPLRSLSVGSRPLTTAKLRVTKTEASVPAELRVDIPELWVKIILPELSYNDWHVLSCTTTWLRGYIDAEVRKEYRGIVAQHGKKKSVSDAYVLQARYAVEHNPLSALLYFGQGSDEPARAFVYGMFRSPSVSRFEWYGVPTLERFDTMYPFDATSGLVGYCLDWRGSTQNQRFQVLAHLAKTKTLPFFSLDYYVPDISMRPGHMPDLGQPSMHLASVNVGTDKALFMFQLLAGSGVLDLAAVKQGCANAEDGRTALAVLAVLSRSTRLVDEVVRALSLRELPDGKLTTDTKRLSALLVVMFFTALRVNIEMTQYVRCLMDNEAFAVALLAVPAWIFDLAPDRGFYDALESVLPDDSRGLLLMSLGLRIQDSCHRGHTHAPIRVAGMYGSAHGGPSIFPEVATSIAKWVRSCARAVQDNFCHSTFTVGDSHIPGCPLPVCARTKTCTSDGCCMHIFKTALRSAGVVIPAEYEQESAPTTPAPRGIGVNVAWRGVGIYDGGEGNYALNGEMFHGVVFPAPRRVGAEEWDLNGNGARAVPGNENWAGNVFHDFAFPLRLGPDAVDAAQANVNVVPPRGAMQFVARVPRMNATQLANIQALQNAVPRRYVRGPLVPFDDPPPPLLPAARIVVNNHQGAPMRPMGTGVVTISYRRIGGTEREQHNQARGDNRVPLDIVPYSPTPSRPSAAAAPSSARVEPVDTDSDDEYEKSM